MMKKKAMLISKEKNDMRTACALLFISPAPAAFTLQLFKIYCRALFLFKKQRSFLLLALHEGFEPIWSALVIDYSSATTGAADLQTHHPPRFSFHFFVGIVFLCNGE